MYFVSYGTRILFNKLRIITGEEIYQKEINPRCTLPLTQVINFEINSIAAD